MVNFFANAILNGNELFLRHSLGKLFNPAIVLLNYCSNSVKQFKPSTLFISHYVVLSFLGKSN